jgi:spore coat protein U-like protein
VSLRLLVAAAALLCSLVGHAAATCTFAANGPNFGTYDPFDTNPDLANGDVRAECRWTGGGTTNITLQVLYGVGSGGVSYTNRFMVSGANTLGYNIYFDAGFTRIRGDGTGGSTAGGANMTVSFFNQTAVATSTIFGRIPAGQNAVPGTYLTTITVTVNY